MMLLEGDWIEQLYLIRPGLVEMPNYGPWDSAARPIHEELVFNHVYEHAGTYTATFKFTTYGNCAYGRSHGTATPTITVTKKP